MSETNDLFKRIGGTDIVNAAAKIFYRKVISDDSMEYLFADANAETQRKNQKAFVAHVFGVPEKKIRNKKYAYKLLELTEDHFNLVTGYLIDTLRELNVPKDLIDEVLDISNKTKEELSPE